MMAFVPTISSGCAAIPKPAQLPAEPDSSAPVITEPLPCRVWDLGFSLAARLRVQPLTLQKHTGIEVLICT